MLLKAIQMVETVKTEAVARSILEALAHQAGYMGGRVLPPVERGWWMVSDPIQVWKVQAFFVDDTAGGSWLPDGMRRVLIPESQKRALGVA